MFIHDRHLQKLVKNLVIPECSFHKMLSKGERNSKKRKEEHLFMCSKPRTFGATQKSLFNMLPKTLFMCAVYDASHIYIATKSSKKKRQKSFATYPVRLSCATVHANSIHVWSMLCA